MPQGNVGTPLSHFMKMISTCSLPAFVIRKLRLKFPKSKAKRRYGAVPPTCYSDSEKAAKTSGVNTGLHGSEADPNSDKETNFPEPKHKLRKLDSSDEENSRVSYVVLFCLQFIPLQLRKMMLMKMMMVMKMMTMTFMQRSGRGMKLFMMM